LKKSGGDEDERKNQKATGQAQIRRKGSGCQILVGVCFDEGKRIRLGNPRRRGARKNQRKGCGGLRRKNQNLYREGGIAGAEPNLFTITGKVDTKKKTKQCGEKNSEDQEEKG